MKRRLAGKEAAAPASARVLIVDDHPFLRLGLAEALAKEPGLCVCGAVGTAEEALPRAEIAGLSPDAPVAAGASAELSGTPQRRTFPEWKWDAPRRASTRGDRIKSRIPAAAARRW